MADRTVTIGLGLVTNCSTETVAVWNASLLSAIFACPTFSCQVGVEKPDPRIYLHASAALNIAPEDCLFVADGSNDELAGARALGMAPVLVRCADDDGSFPGRLHPDDWHGRFITDLAQVQGPLE